MGSASRQISFTPVFLRNPPRSTPTSRRRPPQIARVWALPPPVDALLHTRRRLLPHPPRLLPKSLGDVGYKPPLYLQEHEHERTCKILHQEFRPVRGERERARLSEWRETRGCRIQSSEAREKPGPPDPTAEGQGDAGVVVNGEDDRRR